MAKKFGDFLTENNVSLNEMTIELMVDKCIKEGKSKDGAMEFCKTNDFPPQVHNILKRLPKSIFESMIECEITYESLMEDYEGDLTQMLDDYLDESVYEEEGSDDEDDDKKKKKKEDGEPEDGEPEDDDIKKK